MKTLVLPDSRELTPAAQCAIATRWGNPRMYGAPTRQMRATAKMIDAAVLAQAESEQATLDAALITAFPPLKEARAVAREIRVSKGLERASTDTAINALKKQARSY